MTLREKQSEFVVHVALLIQYAQVLGYQLTFGNTTGKTNWPPSLHPERLAIDLNLFIDGVYQKSSEAHEPLGKFWKALHPDNAHGGDFRPRDGNHYSRGHGGRK